MPRRRLGIALLIPAPLDREIDGLRRACGARSLGLIPAHLTLVPPVNVSEDNLGEGLAVLREAAVDTAPFTITIGPPASFLPDAPVLHLGVALDEGADALEKLRDQVFRRPFERRLTWPFVPHVTLADEMDPDRLAHALAALADYTADVTFRRLHLLEEQPADEGGRRVWKPIADVPFEPRRVIGRGGLPLELTITELVPPDCHLPAGTIAPPASPEVPEPITIGRQEIVVTARRDGEVVGVARGWHAGGVAVLARVEVAAFCHRQGVGSHLVSAFENEALAQGCQQLSGFVVAGERAEAFFLARGWKVEDRMRGEHGGEWMRIRHKLT